MGGVGLDDDVLREGEAEVACDAAGGVERPAELARRAGPAAWEGREARGGVGGGRERAEVRGGRACGRWVGGREPRRGASLGGRAPEGGPVARGEGRRRAEEER